MNCNTESKTGDMKTEFVSIAFQKGSPNEYNRPSGHNRQLFHSETYYINIILYTYIVRYQPRVSSRDLVVEGFSHNFQKTL